MAYKKIEGDFKEQYKRLHDYANELLRSNPGSNVKVSVDLDANKENRIFKRLYVCLKACKVNFISCRPIIGLGGCFLKGKYEGELLSVVGRYGNDQMLPLAYAFVEVKNKETWTWILELLIDDLDGVANCSTYTFISDQQKGLLQAIQELLPHMDKSWIGLKIFEVRHTSNIGEKFVVDLDKLECSCRKWSITGLPCCHALTAMAFLNINGEDYIPYWFAKSTCEETYFPMIYLVNGAHVWEITSMPDLLPPPKRILPGKPKKKRRLKPWELKKDDSQLRQGGTRKRCGTCKQLGHKRNTCPQAAQDIQAASTMPTLTQFDQITQDTQAAQLD